MKTTDDLVSVIIPTYNVALFIEEAIQSILNQTYTNLEIIIVDDCSTDGTYEILENISKVDKRIRLFRNSQNLKIAETLNFGLCKATGNYIARMDGDDISLPNRIEKQVEFLKFNKEIDLVGLNVIAINEKGEEIKRLKYSSLPENAKLIVKYFSPVPHFWVARKETYQRVGEYRIATAEDYDFLLRMASANLNFCNLQEYLYKQRIRQGNTATASGLTQRRLIEYALDLYRERIKANKQIDSYSDEKLELYKQVGQIEKYFFNLSNKFMYKFSIYVQSNKLKAAINLLLTILLSPKYQGTYFYRKYKYNKMLKTD